MSGFSQESAVLPHLAHHVPEAEHAPMLVEHDSRTLAGVIGAVVANASIDELDPKLHSLQDGTVVKGYDSLSDPTGRVWFSHGAVVRRLTVLPLEVAFVYSPEAPRSRVLVSVYDASAESVVRRLWFMPSGSHGIRKVSEALDHNHLVRGSRFERELGRRERHALLDTLAAPDFTPSHIGHRVLPSLRERTLLRQSRHAT